MIVGPRGSVTSHQIDKTPNRPALGSEKVVTMRNPPPKEENPTLVGKHSCRYI